MGHAVTEVSMGYYVSTARILEQDFLRRSCLSWIITLSSILLMSTATYPQRQESRLCPLSSTSHFYVISIQDLATENIRHPHPCIELDELYLRLFHI